MVNQTDNVTGERVLVEEHHFDYFDLLPKPVREALAGAAYSMAAEKIVAWMAECRRGGMDDYQIADLVLFRFKQYLNQKIRDEAKRLYGPDHPQAGPQ